MKKKILLAMILLLTLTGCSKTIPTMKNGDEVIAEFKNGHKISINELYNKLKDSYGTETLIEMVDTYILEDKYKSKLSDGDEYADSYIKSLRSNFTDENGKYDESKLISALKNYGYSSIDEYKKSLRLSFLRKEAVKDYAKTQVSDSQINKYYKEEIVADREISHIQIIPEVKDNMTDSEKEEAENAALKIANAVIAKLKKGEKFEDLAKEYSNDDSTKDKGGSLGKINKGDYGSEEFDNEAFKLEVGKYSTSAVKTENGYEIIYVVSESEKAKLEDVKKDIVEKLADEKVENDSTTMNVEGLKSVRKEYGLDIIDDDLKKNYEDLVTQK